MKTLTKLNQWFVNGNPSRIEELVELFQSFSLGATYNGEILRKIEGGYVVNLAGKFPGFLPSEESFDIPLAGHFIVTTKDSSRRQITVQKI